MNDLLILLFIYLLLLYTHETKTKNKKKELPKVQSTNFIGGFIDFANSKTTAGNIGRCFKGYMYYSKTIYKINLYIQQHISLSFKFLLIKTILFFKK